MQINYTSEPHRVRRPRRDIAATWSIELRRNEQQHNEKAVTTLLVSLESDARLHNAGCKYQYLTP